MPKFVIWLPFSCQWRHGWLYPKCDISFLSEGTSNYTPKGIIIPLCVFQCYVTVYKMISSMFQFFGNAVTCKSWDDIWLNEGFARFYEYRVVQHVNPDYEAVSHPSSPRFLLLLSLPFSSLVMQSPANLGTTSGLMRALPTSMSIWL